MDTTLLKQTTFGGNESEVVDSNHFDPHNNTEMPSFNNSLTVNPQTQI